MNHERYVVELEPMPGFAVDPIQRLRRFLKAAKRSFGLRCIGVSAASTSEKPAAEEAADVATAMATGDATTDTDRP